LLTEPVSKEVDAYVRQCIDLVWYMYMYIQQPHMEIMWAKPGEKLNKEVFLLKSTICVLLCTQCTKMIISNRNTISTSQCPLLLKTLHNVSFDTW
jgi:hypothetical protein